MLVDAVSTTLKGRLSKNSPFFLLLLMCRFTAGKAFVFQPDKIWKDFLEYVFFFFFFDSLDS